MKARTKHSPSYLQQILTILIVSTFVLPATSTGQSFDEGLSLYQKGQFSKAAKVFRGIDSDKGRLFSGKAYFGMGEYITAKTYLSQVREENSSDFYLESQYTIALADFQLGLFGDALNRLNRMMQRDRQTQIVADAGKLYDDILGFLTMNQRKQAFQSADHPQIKFDLVQQAFGTVSYPVAQTLYRQLLKSNIDSTSEAMQKLSALVADSMSYAVEMAYNNQRQAPDGIVYDIGAALPEYDNENPQFEVSQGLYFGYILAAEEFNQQHSNKKAFIRHGNTAANMDSADHVMTNFAWNYSTDAVLGPLFSKPARRMAKLAEQYQVPLIAPLANSDTLNVDNPYVYQANPTFSSHGRKMAEYAVRNLNMDTLAVLAERNSLGEASAFSFREHAEKLGAKVSYFFVEDLQSQGYELTDYTKYFTTDPALIDSLKYHQLDAVYAPFTGQAASTLAELLLVDLNAMNSDLTVLGSQEWGNFQFSETEVGNRNIYFSESFYVDNKNPKVEQFTKRYKQRFDREPNRFAMIGYDAASFVLKTLDNIANPALLKNALKSQPVFEGLISNISFNGTHINQEVKIFRINEQGTQPVVK